MVRDFPFSSSSTIFFIIIFYLICACLSHAHACIWKISIHRVQNVHVLYIHTSLHCFFAYSLISSEGNIDGWAFIFLLKVLACKQASSLPRKDSNHADGWVMVAACFQLGLRIDQDEITCLSNKQLCFVLFWCHVNLTSHAPNTSSTSHITITWLSHPSQ